MTMSDYLGEIEYAAGSIVPVIWGERTRLQELRGEVAKLERVVEDNYLRAESVAMNAEDADDVMMATGMHWDTYFGEDKERFYKDKDRQKLQGQVATHAFAVGSLAGSLLQYAKQGISLVHGSLSTCPPGRMIGSQALKDIIWQGRNQSIHWEEGNPRTPVKLCFDTLAFEIDSVFADYTKRNVAPEVVELLGWVDFASFRADLLSLG